MKRLMQTTALLFAVIIGLSAAASLAETPGEGHGGKKEGCQEAGGKGGGHAGHAEAAAASQPSSQPSGQSGEARRGGEGSGHGGGMACCAGGGKGMGQQAQGSMAESSGDPPQRMRRHGRRSMQGGPRGQHAVGRGGSQRGVMHKAMTLVHNNGSITRTIEEIPGGVRTVTTTSDPAMLATLREHPREMMELHEQGGSVRHWDPLFTELARHHEKIRMTFKDIENGIEVESTSEDADVVKLIRVHAYKVSEFVERGHAAVHETTPLPEGYKRED